MTSPKISIIVPAYNSATTIERCVRSIFNQTFRDWELIIVDNGSTDGTSGLVSSIARGDDRIILLFECEKGVSNARNRGLDAARGEFICFVDSDDTVEPNYLEELFRYSSNDLVVCGYYLDFYDENENKIGSESHVPNPVEYNFTSSKNCLFSTFTNGYIHLCCNKLFRQSVIDKHDLRFESYPVNEDYIFIMKYLLLSNSIYILTKPLYHWIRVANTTTGVNSLPPNLLLIYNESHQLTREFFQDNTIADKIAYYSYDLILVYKYYGACNNGDFSKNELYTRVKEFVCNKLVIDAYKAYRPLSKVDFILYWLVRLRLYRLHHFIYTKVLKIRN